MNNKKAAAIIMSIAMLNTGAAAPLDSATEEIPSDTVQNIYVSPDGSDEGSGSITSPVRTLKRARDMVRTLNSDMTEDINVIIAPGTYYMEETLELLPEDSGTNGYRVTYMSGAGTNEEKPIISGGVDITDGWTVYDSDKGIYKRENIDWSFRQLYTNNQRAIRARYPNLENIETGGPYLRATGGNGAYPLFIGRNNEYAQKAGSNAEIIWNSSWSQFRARIDRYDASNGRLYFKSPDSTFAWNHHTQGDTPYFLENSLEYLDAEGEWFLDTDSHTLYYKPRSGETMNETQIIAPKLETIVDIKGESKNNTVKNITFSGLRFLHSNWLAPDSYGYCSVQGGFRYQSEGGRNNSAIRGSARYDAPKSMVQLKYTDGIELKESEFSFSGSWGVMGYEGTANTLIDHNVFLCNAGGGVTMGMAGREWDDQTEDENPRSYTDMDGQSIGDTITNNLIDHVACEYQDMVGIGAMLPQHMTIANNEIGYLPYTGINIGWNWLDTDHGMTANKVYQNYIHDTCMLLQDGGGIYSLGRMNGDSNFYYNYITNIKMSEWAPHDNLMGIYFDNGSCYKKAQANVFSNTVYAFQASNPPNHDNIFEGNYYNCPKGISSTGSSASIANKPFSADAIPQEVQNIIDHAGIDKAPLPNPSSRVNLAFRKSVVSSETDDVQPASNATDGDASTMWEQYVKNRPDSSKSITSLTVDLEDSYHIDEIMITFQYGNRSRYKIECSEDKENWKTSVDKLYQNPSSSESVYEDMNGVTARYIKLTMNTEGWGAGVREIYVYSNEGVASASAELSKTSEAYYKNPALKQEITFTALLNGCSVTQLKNGGYTLTSDVDYENHWGKITLKTSYLDTLANGSHEIAVEFDKSAAKTFTVNVSEDDGTSNLALNKPVTADTYNTNENRYAEYMTDGKADTRWAQKQGTNGTHNQINIDLGRVYDVRSVIINWELPGVNYKIEYSSDGNTYEIYTDKLSEATASKDTVDIKQVNARYFRFEVNHDQWGASIWEIQILGIDDSKPSDDEPVEDIYVYSIEPENGTLSRGSENQITVTLKENSPVENAIVYVALYKDDRLCSAAVNRKPAFDSDGLNTNVYRLKTPDEEGSCKIKVFLWKDTQIPITADVFEKNFTLQKQ